MRRLPLRLLAVAVALIGLVALADLEQRALRRGADRTLAEAVAGYLGLVVPPTGAGGFAPDRLVSTVSRLAGAAFWHAGLQVTLAGAPVLDDVTPPATATWWPLINPAGTDSVGRVVVWNTAPRGLLPGVSWVLAVATCLAAGLATTRRAGWLWPVLGMLLAVASVRTLLTDTRRVADRAAEASLAHVGPMAALVLLDGRVPVAALARLGGGLQVCEAGHDGIPAPPGWSGDRSERRATLQFARGSGVVVELALAPPAIGSRALDYGLAGGVLILFLAMLPPIMPRRRSRLPSRSDGATIPR